MSTLSSQPDTITIPLSEYRDLQQDSQWLSALEAAGVDNWEGLEVAREIHNEWNYEEDEEV